MRMRGWMIGALAALALMGCDTGEEPIEAPSFDEEPAEVPDRFVALQLAPPAELEADEAPAEHTAPTKSKSAPVDSKAARAQAGIGDLDIGTAGRGGSGRGGMGMRGTGKGGGGVGSGRIAGLGRVSTGGGGGVAGVIGHGRGYAPRPRIRPAPPANTEAYKNPGVNEATPTAKDRFSTFAVDVDTGSYTIARRKLDGGQLPPKDSVRVEEFINYFDYSYPDPKSGAFGVHLEAAPSPFTADASKKIVRVGVQGKRVSRSARKPVHLTFLVDVSGSMSTPDKLQLAQRSLKVLTNSLQEGDTVAIATYAGRVAKILDPTSIDKRGQIMSAIDSLRSGGSTAMNSGLELAYKLALANFERDHVNRVIVLSDGDANVGPSSHKEILKRIRHFVDEGVTLSSIGFGMGNYKDTMMEQLANNGDGNYYYIDSLKEALKVFGDQVDGTLQVIAKDVKIQVEFDPKTVKSYRLVGYENRDIADKDFRNDKVDAGEIGAGHSVTALYEIELADTDAAKKADRLATVRVRHKQQQRTKASEQAFELTRAQLRDSLQKASADFQFAAAVAGFAEILRVSPYAKKLSLSLIEEVAKGATAGQADRKEFLELVRKAKALKG